MNLDETAIQQVSDYFSLMRLLSEKLDWEIDPQAAQDEVTFDWSGDELHLSESSAQRLNGGVVRQLRLPVSNSPWGIFFVEFDEQNVYRTVLRQVLRGLVPKRRREPNPPAWQHDNLLFICTTADYERFTFAHFRGQQANRAVLATFSWERGDTHVRTLCEFNLPALAWPDDPLNEEAWLKQWRAAFDVEAVTGKFFTAYRGVFEDVEAQVETSIRDKETARLYTQRLLNRLMFLYFIQKKGWLSFEGDKRYLRALFTRGEADGENFMRDRLYWVFFYGMSNVGESREVHEKSELLHRRGEVPYLNGGLFDMEDEFDQRGQVKLPNEVFAAVLDLFERYNFTVTESTPLDVQVAVDPEMLGKVFEELVTGRHESGSYYTPRPIVSFMCREALKYYLIDTAGLSQHEVERFVDDGEAEELPNAERVLEALKTVRVCDPACGSGAYLLGMMQELLRLRSALFKSKQLDSDSVYLRKRSIIENNLYGVDKDEFAVQIACLRLWLSLAIESEKPQPLPNLDFKIECGDSLAGPAPDTNEQQLDLNRSLLVGKYQAAKGRFLTCENSERKKKLRGEIDDLQREIALALKHQPLRPSPQKIEVARQQLKEFKRQLRQAQTEKITRRRLVSRRRFRR
ncbi:MAG TPA: DNA methyltransferase [Blastocatellia bacterium]|nr:DNA methyltransferase [Blastocatellia bacterium]